MSRRYRDTQEGNSQSNDGTNPGSGPQIQLQSRLHGLRSDIQTTNELIEQATRLCTMVGLDLSSLGDTTKVQEIDTTLRSLIDTQHKLSIEHQLITQAASSLDSETAESQYLREYEREKRKYEGMGEREKYGESSVYREFRQQMWELTHEGQPMPALFAGGQDGEEEEEQEEELVFAGARITYKCPITASWLTDPVTSKTCKHSFSSDAIKALIRSQNGNAACPVVGCAHRIALRDLEHDGILERKVAIHLRQLEEQESTATYTMVQ
ncbi:hypothetical protein LPJ73_000419 [Coemansia sp. RSA 2703]|nr:hypothetical protein LPJ73_000419 [Coemansia sp. RSA 2703]KAJ2372933.1 hypothetical protein IW150_003872 [Coemansia sp. RSA 2607]KAJ2395842.1 hypothetical protein GGI05_001396 [Coemansia sp. RSA 2603]